MRFFLFFLLIFSSLEGVPCSSPREKPREMREEVSQNSKAAASKNLSLKANCRIKLVTPLTAKSAYLINADTGAVLFEKNPHQPHYPSSTVKIATALYALKQRGDQLDALLIAEQDAVGAVSEEQMRRSQYFPAYRLTHGASHIGLKRGEILSFQDLLYGLLVASGGDAANVIAAYISGTVPAFIQEMNDYLKELGCSNTVFKNPHGLYHPDQVTTAHDLALMTREAMKIPLFRQIVKATSYTKPATNKQPSVTLGQTNKLLRKGPYHYPLAIGVKTGTLEVAHNLVAAAAKGDRTLIAVVMKCEKGRDTFKETAALFKAAFAEEKVERILFPENFQNADLFLQKVQKPVKTYLKEKIAITYYPSEEPVVRSFLEWNKLTLPIIQDQQVGMLSVVDEKGKVLKKAPLFAQSPIKADFWQRLQENVSLKKLVALCILLLVGGFLFWPYWFNLKTAAQTDQER